MNKTQAFKAFELIMRCMFWILYRMSNKHQYDKNFDMEIDEIMREYANFMARES